MVKFGDHPNIFFQNDLLFSVRRQSILDTVHKNKSMEAN